MQDELADRVADGAADRVERLKPADTSLWKR